jgi:predicted cupin superfamily sugar epimerase
MSSPALSSACAWIKRLDLLPHPEGGHYRESYRAADQIAAQALPAGFGGNRAFSTAIYFLLESPQVSRLHRLKSDEIWHHYEGSALEILSVSPGGVLTRARLGKDIGRGELPQYVVPAGHWFGSRVLADTGFALVGCTVAPGFDFADFEMANAGELSAELLEHRQELADLIQSSPKT